MTTISKTILFCTISLICSSDSFSQNQKTLDSLFKVLKTTKQDSSLVNAYSELCWEYNSSNPDTALYFGNLGLNLAIKTKHKKGLSSCYNNIAIVHKIQGTYDKAIEYYLKSLKIYEEQVDKKGMSTCYNNIGIVYKEQGAFDKAIEYYLKSLNNFEELGDKKGISACYINIGIVHMYQGTFDKAIEYYLKSLKINEELGDKKRMAACYNNIGIVHKEQGTFDKAIEYYLKSLKIKEELNDKKGMSACYNNIGLIYSDQGIYNKAIEYYLKSLKIDEELGDKKGISNSYNNIGLAHSYKGSYDKAIEYYLKSLKIDEEIGDKNGIACVWGNIAGLHLILANSVSTTQTEKTMHYNEAVEFGLKALNLAKEIKALPLEKDASNNLMKAYKKLGNYKKSVEYAVQFIATRDSMFKEEKIKAFAGMEAKYQNEKKQLEIEKLGKEKELQLSENKKQKIVILFVASGLLLILVIAVLIFRSLRITKKQKRIIENQKVVVDEKNTLLNQQNEEIRTQRDEIEAQRDEITMQRDEITAQRDLVTIQKEQIEEIHEELTDSIRYAERIQKAVLPSLEYTNRILSDYFILFKPKDIVSGDFYWISLRKNRIFVAVADCTGHGVPGGFMSMLGISFLNEIVSKDEIKESSQVLNELRKYVIKSLQQKGIDGEQKDGMDMALCAINIDTLEMQFAGANNPLYIVSSQQSAVGSQQPESQLPTATANCQLLELKGDKMPIGIYSNMQPFINQIHLLQKGDTIYLMSDGYEDQFGGPNRKKFLAKNLKQLLMANCQLPMANQQEILNNTFENWKGEFEQIDDVTVLGIRI